MASQKDCLVWPIQDLPALRVFCAEQEAGDEGFLTSLLAFIAKYTDSPLTFLSFVRSDTPDWIVLRKIYPKHALQHLNYRQGFDLPIGGDELREALRSMSGWVASTRQPHRCGNVKDRTQAPYYLAMDDHVAATMVVPVLFQQTLVGLLGAESYQQDQYTAGDLQWLIDVAACVAERLAAIRTREVEAYRRRDAVEDFATLCSESFTTSEDFLLAALKSIVRRTEAGDGYARIVDGQRLTLKAAYRRNTPVQSYPPLGWAKIFLPIGRPAELTPSEYSFTGYIAATQRPERTADSHDGPARHPGVPQEIHAMVGAPICFRGQLLGVLVLHHTERDFFTSEHEDYLAAFASLIAPPLQGFLTSESPRLAQPMVRSALQQTVQSVETAYEFAEPRVVAALAQHIATALASKLCSIWLIHPLGPLVWRGVSGLTLRPLPRTSEPSADTAAWQALRDAFGPLPRVFALGQEVNAAAVAAEVLRTRTLGNYGPNRDALAFQQRGFHSPFLLAPLITREGEMLGVLHVSLKEPTPMNPRGIYTEADEHLLESLQMELVDLYERQRLRETAEYAAQDLHDALGLLTYDLLYGVDALRHAWTHQQADRIPDLLHAFETKAQSLHGEIRAIMGALRSHVLEEKGLVVAVEHYIKENVQRPGLEISFAPEDLGPLPLKLAWQLYRIIQEALTNIVKHASATHAHCELRVRPRHLTVHIYDNGRGFAQGHPQSPGRHGLGNLRRRAQGLGGRARFRSSSSGTFLSVRVPRKGGSDVTPIA